MGLESKGWKPWADKLWVSVYLGKAGFKAAKIRDKKGRCKGLRLKPWNPARRRGEKHRTEAREDESESTRRSRLEKTAARSEDDVWMFDHRHHDK